MLWRLRATGAEAHTHWVQHSLAWAETIPLKRRNIVLSAILVTLWGHPSCFYPICCFQTYKGKNTFYVFETRTYAAAGSNLGKRHVSLFDQIQNISFRDTQGGLCVSTWQNISPPLSEEKLTFAPLFSSGLWLHFYVLEITWCCSFEKEEQCQTSKNHGIYHWFLLLPNIKETPAGAWKAHMNYFYLQKGLPQTQTGLGRRPPPYLPRQTHSNRLFLVVCECLVGISKVNKLCDSIQGRFGDLPPSGLLPQPFAPGH